LSVVFADTSALVKRYVPEIGSPWVENWFAPGQNTIVAISELALLEFFSALARRLREGSVAPAIASQLQNDMLLHARDVYLIVRLESRIIDKAKSLVFAHPIRSLDAIHLVSAQESISYLGTTPTFVSADVRLLAAAALEGFPTDNPNAH
jgi:predicted nucleic acid-binding protein